MATLLLGPGPTHLCEAASRRRTSGPNPAAPCASGCGHRSHPVVVGAPWLGPIAGRLGGHRVGSAKAGQPGQALSLPVLCQDKTPQGLTTAFQLLQAQNVSLLDHIRADCFPPHLLLSAVLPASALTICSPDAARRGLRTPGGVGAHPWLPLTQGKCKCPSGLTRPRQPSDLTTLPFTSSAEATLWPQSLHNRADPSAQSPAVLPCSPPSRHFPFWAALG